MPRPLRIEFKDAWYHVMNRGAAQKNIYKTDQHRFIFLNLLREASLYYNLEIHAYCLMSNHYHLLINTPQGNLSQGMRHINGIYTQKFNLSENIDGSLFRGRYRAILVEDDSYLLQVSRYIHLNPVEARLVDKPENYPWSSYKDYITPPQTPWLQTHFIKEMLNAKNNEIAYQNFVNAGNDIITRDFYSSQRQPVIFGEKSFKNLSLHKVAQHKLKHSKPDYNRTHEPPTLQTISTMCARHFNISEESLFHYQLGNVNLPRKVAMYFCRVIGQARLEDIALYFRCKTKSGASNAVANIKYELQKDPLLKEQMAILEIKIVRGQVYR